MKHVAEVSKGQILKSRMKFHVGVLYGNLCNCDLCQYVAKCAQCKVRRHEKMVTYLLMNENGWWGKN